MQQLPHDTRPSAITVLFLNAVGGAVGGVIVALFVGLEPGLLAIVALSGALILSVAEAASWLGGSRWIQGLLFGAVAGLLIALAIHWITSPDTRLLNLIIACVIGGIVGGLIFKGFSGTARPEAAT